MADINDLKPSDAYLYFKETLFPFGVSRYQLRQNNVPSTSSEGRFQEPLIINALIQCIQVYNISIKKINFPFNVIYMHNNPPNNIFSIVLKRSVFLLCFFFLIFGILYLVFSRPSPRVLYLIKHSCSCFKYYVCIIVDADFREP